jgi:hypothetical protein
MSFHERLDLFIHVWRLREAADHENVLFQLGYGLRDVDIRLIRVVTYLDVDLASASCLRQLLL